MTNSARPFGLGRNRVFQHNRPEADVPLVEQETNISQHSIDVIADAIFGLRGLPCWGVITGQGTGSYVSLMLGMKIQRSRPVANKFLSDDVRRYDAEFSLFIQLAPWELLRGDTLLCNSDSSNLPGDQMLDGLKALIGEKIMEADLNEGFGLVIRCSSALQLKIYYDPKSAGNNYSIFSPRRDVVNA